MQINRCCSHVSLPFRSRLLHRIRVRIASPDSHPRVLADPTPPSHCFSFPPYRSSGLPHFISGTQNPTAQHRKAKVHKPIHFASAAQSVGTRTTNGAPVFVPVDQIHLEFIPSGSFPSIVHENTTDKTASNRREIV